MEEMNTRQFPVICTRDVVIFPNEEVAIEVGRDISLNALRRANESFNSEVLVVSQIDPMVDQPDISDLYEVGTICRIVTTHKKDAFTRTVFKGISRARIIDMNEMRNTKFASVEVLNDISGDANEELILVRKVSKEIESMEALASLITPNMARSFAKGISANRLADHIAQIFPFSLNQRQKLLETLDINTRLLHLLEAIEQEKQLLAIDNEINQKVRSRVEESQKEYFLRERMRAIKEELGDVSEPSDDSDKIRQQLEDNPYPENIKAKVLEELSRYDMLPASSGESGVIKSYIDWLMKLPYWQTSEDNDDLARAQQILDEDHYGLVKVKERIMEYLAVKQMTNSLKAPILCLVGPPGVGKTSLAKSVARSLDRKFVKISLGGVHDEAEIRGHRRTYLGSMPGRIIQGMKKAGTINPVFLIDEIDKMASDYKGDPSSAMLEVLDPEQNSLFSDHYIEEPYDLSQVLFIATANYLENIPSALQDRLEIIQLSSYTEEEKVQIAKRHLVTKQMEMNGLKPNQFKIKDDILLYLIQYYTREAGVRQLERVIGTCARKAVLAILKDNKKSISVTKKMVNEWLGHEIYDYGRKEKKNQIGTVTGLAYTSFGGDILQVEVTHFEGKGKFVLTGKLGDVMKESASIAYDYVRANAKQYKIESKVFDQEDIHIHVPEGAVPKDGPSAGVTLTTAIVSSLTNTPVRADIAMTGEVTLRGNVLPIGGLKEKSLAAHRSGIQTILVPKANMKDIDEIPASVKESMKIIPVEHVSQVIDYALVR